MDAGILECGNGYIGTFMKRGVRLGGRTSICYRDKG